MKILYVIGSRLMSGCEDHLFDLARWFRGHGVDPVFVLRAGSQLQEKLEASGIRCYPAFIPGNKAGLPFRIAQAISAEKPDVISVNREHNILPSVAGMVLSLPFVGRRPKMVAVFHTPTGRWYPGLGRFDGIIGTSEYTAGSFVRANPGIRSRTEVIRYGITLPAADAAAKRDRDRPRRFFRDRKFPVIGMVGELWKNQEELVDIAPALVERFPDITIAIIGGYEGGDLLRQKIAASRLEDHFVLTGRVARESIPDVFFDLDLSVSTHRNEGFGIVHIESLAAYTPVVAYNSGGLVEILEKGGGVLVDGAVPEFAAAVVDLLQDDDQRMALGEEGRHVVEKNFSVDAMGQQHLEFYRKIVGEK